MLRSQVIASVTPPGPDFCSETNAVSSLASPHIPQASPFVCWLGHCEPCSCVCSSLSGPGRKVFVREDPQDNCCVLRPHCQTPLCLGTWARTHGPGLWEAGPGLWEAVPGSLVCLPQIDIYDPGTGNLVSELIFVLLFILAALLRTTWTNGGMRGILLWSL